MKGVVSAGDPQTAAAGAAMLKHGGNAVDAAVAAAFAACVCESVLVNICGGGIANVVDGDGNASVYDFFSDMPSGKLAPDADFREILVDFGSETQPFYIGRASVAVPSVVAGLCRMAQSRGALPLPVLLEPAIRLARSGAVLSPALEYILDILLPIFTDTPALAALYQTQGQTYRAGAQMVFHQLAATLEKLGEVGPELFYSGAVGTSIVADQQSYGGLVTAADLTNYLVRETGPIRIEYRNNEILLPPPASSGGVLIAFTLKLLTNFDISEIAHNSYKHVRLLAEAIRLTSIARRDWERGNGSAERRVSEFLSSAHLEKYTTELQAVLAGSTPRQAADFAPGPASTTHISVVDEYDTVVSLTFSAGENAGFVLGDTGVFLNNMLGEIDLHPDGFHHHPAGTRLQTMMSPVVVRQAGLPVLAIGSGGSNRLRSAILQVVSNSLDFGMPLQAAIDAPRVHFESDVLQLEGGIDPRVAARCEQADYRVNLWPERNMFFGGAHGVARQSSSLVAAGDARRGGAIAIA